MSWVEEGQEPRSIDLKEGKYASLPDGNYKLTIAANNDGPSSTEQSITYNFRIDTKAPRCGQRQGRMVPPFRWSSAMSRPCRLHAERSE